MHNLGVARDELPMPEFNLEHEAVFHVYVGSKWNAAKTKELRWDPRAEGEVEMRWFEAWYRGYLLRPDPVAPTPW